MPEETLDSRYPYTYACDFLRSLGPCNHSGVVLSRSDASTICEGIAKALGMDSRELACRLADHELALEDDPVEIQRRADQVLRALGY